MTPMLQTLKNIQNRDRFHGMIVKTMAPCKNDYSTELLPIIPARTNIECDFGGDFGMYGVADVGGVLYRVKIEVNELHNIDFNELDARFG